MIEQARALQAGAHLGPQVAQHQAVAHALQLPTQENKAQKDLLVERLDLGAIEIQGRPAAMKGEIKKFLCQARAITLVERPGLKPDQEAILDRVNLKEVRMRDVHDGIALS